MMGCPPEIVAQCREGQIQTQKVISELQGDMQTLKATFAMRLDQSVRDKARAISDFEGLRESVEKMGEKHDAALLSIANRLQELHVAVSNGRILAKVGSVVLVTLGGAIGWGINLYVELTRHVVKVSASALDLLRG